MATTFLTLLARAIHRRGVDLLHSPPADFLDAVAADVLAAWQPPPDERRGELETLGRADAAEIQRLAEDAVRAIDGGLSEDDLRRLTAWLAQTPVAIRQAYGLPLPDPLPLNRPDDLACLLPRRLARFRAGDVAAGTDLQLVELLSTSDFGEAWAVRNVHVPEDPLPVLEVCLDADATQTLKDESERVGSLVFLNEIPGLVRLRAAFPTADPPSLLYERTEGEPFAALVRSWHFPGTIPPVEAILSAWVQLVGAAAALCEAQPAPIAHGELTAANVVVQRVESGILLRIAGLGRRPNAGPRDDVHALGVLLYQMLTGDLRAGPPTAPGWADDLRSKHPTLPADVVELLGACFRPSADRPPDARTLRAAIGMGQSDEARSADLRWSVRASPGDRWLRRLYLRLRSPADRERDVHGDPDLPPPDLRRPLPESVSWVITAVAWLLSPLPPLILAVGVFVEPQPGAWAIASAILGVLLSLCAVFGMCFYGMPGTFWRKSSEDFGPLAPLVGFSFFLWGGMCICNVLVLGFVPVLVALLLRLLVWRWQWGRRELAARFSKRRQFEAALGPLPAELPATLEEARRQFLGD
jgi:hypothetical protein